MDCRQDRVVLTNTELAGLISGLTRTKKRRKNVTVIYNAFAPQFHAALIKKYLPADAREDIIQETFVNLLKFVDSQVRKNKPINLEFPKAWLYRIFHNCTTAHIQSTKFPPPELPDDMKSSSETLACPDSENQKQLLDFSMSFDKVFEYYALRHPLCATALEQIIIEGDSMQELMVFLEKTYGATRQFVSDCRKKLLLLWKQQTALPGEDMP